MIFSMQTTLICFFKVTLDKEYVFNGEKCYVGKLSKGRLTVLVAVNSDGSRKMHAVVVEKSAKSQCFKNVKTCHAFVPARHAQDDYNKVVEAGRKISLFIDNCSAHFKIVELAFLPPCTTSKVQPTVQGSL